MKEIHLATICAILLALFLGMGLGGYLQSNLSEIKNADTMASTTAWYFLFKDYRCETTVNAVICSKK